MEADEEFDIYSMKDNRNLRAKGVSNKSNNAREVARRAKQTEKRANQAQGRQEEPEPEVEEPVQTTKYSNGKVKKEKPKDEPYVEVNEQVGKPLKKVEKQMRRQ